MRITYYTRDTAGQITGPRESDGWESVADFLADVCRADETPDREALTEWGHADVTWYGDTGIADTSLAIDRLCRAGRLLFGDRWQSDLARALSVGDRRVREWLAGDRSIPKGIWPDLARLVRLRNEAGSAILAELGPE